MNEQIERLSNKLDETEQVYAKLLELEKNKQEAILGRDPARVMTMLDDERELIALAADYETELLILRDAIGSKMGDLPASGGEPVTLREISDALDGPLAARLEDKRHRLVELAMGVRQTSQTNFLLLRQCTQLLDEIIRASSGDAPGCVTYGNGGVPAASAGRPGTLMNVVAGD